MITRQKMEKLIRALISLRDAATDESALESVDIYPAWKADTEYAVGYRVAFGGNLYKCVQAHTSQADWTPDATPALWTRVSIDEWPEWIQPTGAQDAYNTGDKVSHNEKHWVSLVDANVWEPGAVGTESLWQEA